MRFNLAFTLVMLAVFAAMVGVAAQYPPDARFMPWVIGIPALALCLVQLVLELRSGGRPDGGAHAAAQDAVPQPPGSMAREAAMWGYFLGFVGGILLFGFLAAVPVFIVVFLRHRARAGWPLALGLAAGASLLLYLVFVQALNVALHPGFVIQSILDRLAE